MGGGVRGLTPPPPPPPEVFYLVSLKIPTGLLFQRPCPSPLKNSLIQVKPPSEVFLLQFENSYGPACSRTLNPFPLDEFLDLPCMGELCSICQQVNLTTTCLIDSYGKAGLNIMTKSSALTAS